MKKLLMIITVVAIILGLRSCMSDSKDEKAAKDAVIAFCDSIRNNDVDKFIDVVCIEGLGALRDCVNEGDPTGIKRKKIVEFMQMWSPRSGVKKMFENDIEISTTTCGDSIARVALSSCDKSVCDTLLFNCIKLVELEVREIGNKWLVVPSLISHEWDGRGHPPSSGGSFSTKEKSHKDEMYGLREELQLASKIPTAIAEMLSIAEKESKRAMDEGTVFLNAIKESDSKRKSAGQPSIWPRLSKDIPYSYSNSQRNEQNDISQKTYGSNSYYYEDLFDVKNLEKVMWTPYIAKDVVISLLSENKPRFRVSPIWDFQRKWSIVAGDFDSLPDWFPVLISANTKTDNFMFEAGKYDLRDNRSQIQLIDTGLTDWQDRGTIYEGANWENISPERKKFCWQYEYLIVIRKNGQAERIPREKCTMAAIFPEPFEIAKKTKFL